MEANRLNNIREEWVSRMLKIVDPVLTHFADGTFKQEFPFEFHQGKREFAMLEALGRTVTGIAPWLELPGLSGEERQLQEKYTDLTLRAIGNAVDANSSDYVNFTHGNQPLVDAAFLAHGLLRAPSQLAARLPESVRDNLILELKKTRKILPWASNWMFFSAMVEAGLKVLGEEDIDELRVLNVVEMFSMWYKGDGIYGDGANLHCDYYNSFVIHPMYIDLLEYFSCFSEEFAQRAERAYCSERLRASRYATILERMIGPDGAYPILGRSICYRFGAFHMLAQAALEKRLEEQLPPAQVRCALTAVLRRVMDGEPMFDGNGWLVPGVCGWQPELAEEYINRGSLYLCSVVFLPLGLNPEDEFWTGEECDWTGKKVFSGKKSDIDHAMSW